MDADPQHDETLLPSKPECLDGGDCDFVVCSRYVTGGPRRF